MTESTMGWGHTYPFWNGRGSFLVREIYLLRREAADALLEWNKHRLNRHCIEGRRNRLAWLRRRGYRVVRVRLEVCP